jgi:ribosomal protein L40E
MSLTVQCAQCGAENPADRIFCRACGGRLTLEENRIQSSERKAGARKSARRGVALLVLLALLAASGMTIWPMDPAGRPGMPSDAAECVEAMKRLEWAEEAGRGHAECFTEPMLNGYLEAMRRDSESRAAGEGPYPVRDLRVSIEEERIRLSIQVQRGPILQSVSAVVTPRIGGDGLFFVVDHMALGHLPLPSFFQEWMLRPIESLFESRARERALFASMDRVKVKDADVWLAVVHKQSP